MICLEMVTLSDAAVVAAATTSTAKANWDTAKRENKDIERHTIALFDARAAERCALVALYQHKLLHGCGDSEEAARQMDSTRATQLAAS
jgi:hypothetical protein